jgi:putative transposase
LSAIGVDPEGRRRVLGVSAALSEAEVHWRSFLDDLVGRGLRGVRFITSDDHAGLRAARQAVFPGAQWQRCQFHLAQNAIHHAPNVTIRKAIGAELRRVWNASTLVSAQEELDRLVKTYQSTAPKLATWLESAVPEGLTVFSLPDQHRRRMRTANPIERAIQQEIKRRTSKVRVFPNEAALLRLVTAILVETRTGQPPIASTSICSTKMTEAPKSEFPEIRLLNP